jgi:hypothetical protein
MIGEVMLVLWSQITAGTFFAIVFVPSGDVACSEKGNIMMGLKAMEEVVYKIRVTVTPQF